MMFRLALQKTRELQKAKRTRKQKISIVILNHSKPELVIGFYQLSSERRLKRKNVIGRQNAVMREQPNEMSPKPSQLQSVVQMSNHTLAQTARILLIRLTRELRLKRLNLRTHRSHTNGSMSRASTVQLRPFK